MKKNETFSDFFVEDEDEKSLQYTACIAVKLFEGLLEYNIIAAEKIVTEDCCRMNLYKYSVPKGFVPPNPASAGHCVTMKYKYTGNVGKYTLPQERRYVKELFEIAVCKEITDPREPHGEIVEFLEKKFKREDYRKSTIV